MELIYDDAIRKMLLSATIFLYNLKAYMMVYTVTKFRDPSFSKSDIEVGEGAV